MSNTSKEKTVARFIRLPLKLDRALQLRAKKNQRSVNGQIIYELNQQPNA